MTGGTPRVLVAGGGVAALELVLALRERTGGRLRATLLSPDPRFRFRPLAAYAGLVADETPALDLTRFTAHQGAGLIRGRLTAVDAPGRSVTTDHDGHVPFDALVVATGATPREGLPGAITLGTPRDERALADLGRRVRAGEVERVAIVVPPGVGWSLPAYELALVLRHAAPEGRTSVAVVTSEAAPMAVAGAEFSAAVADLLERRDVQVVASTWPEAVEDGLLWMPLQGASRVDDVVALARPYGPSLPGLPCDERGFLLVDAHGRVRGQQRVWAAGDVASHAVKQGGFAVHQADGVAEDVARHLDLEHLLETTQRPPVLRVALLDGDGTLYLRAEHVDGSVRTEVSSEPLWWPPTKIAGGRLPSWLAADAAAARDAAPGPLASGGA